MQAAAWVSSVYLALHHQTDWIIESLKATAEQALN